MYRMSKELVAVCHWGRSGSWLVASYLDGHEDVLHLPAEAGQQIYPFFDHHEAWSLRDKLIAYPIYSTIRFGLKYSTNFFQGDFPIAAADYYAAVDALFKVYGHLPPQLLGTSRAFLQFLHVAYGLALNQRPSSSRPIIVHWQHWWDNVLAQRLARDFPQAKFLHTVRDPITAFDRSLGKTY